MIKLNAANNRLKYMFDFKAPANLEWVDFSGNQIITITNVHANPYLKYLYLDNNSIAKIEGLENNKNLRVLSLNANQISKIENLPNLWIEELFLSANQISKIEGLSTLPVLRTLDLSKNQISKLRGLQSIQSLKFLNLSLNNVGKVRQLKYIENLPLITEVDLCVNPIQSSKYYRLQTLFHMPQLRMLDGVEISSEEKVKAENLHGYDLQDREIIFKSLLPDEKFVDRRIATIEEVAPESDSDEDNLMNMESQAS
jgi:internalin A